MGVDFRNMSVAEAADILNSSPLGEIAADKDIRRHRYQAGSRIGAHGKIHFFRYAAWLFNEARAPKPEKLSQASIMRERRKEDRDIGAIPAVANPERKARCRLDLRMFLATYFSTVFFRPFSPDHDRVIANTQLSILSGGRFADGIFRGFGKTVIGECSILWAALYGHKKLVPIIGATEGDAEEIIDSLKTALETNDLLCEDFPEACFPFRALEGIPHRCAGQLCEGRPTHVYYGRMELILPVIPGSAASDVKIVARGLTGRIRGMKHKRQDGEIVRPDFVFIDDPQNDESAKSPSQCDYRERLITGAVLGLAGHSKQMSAMMACTVIKKGDLADRFLDRDRHPGWQGGKFQLVRKWADRHEDLWLGEYAALIKQDISDSRGGSLEALRQATEFYRLHRAEMDAGADVAWKECFFEGELSAVQHAYNLLLDRGEAVFMAEYQMTPPDEFALADEPPLEPKDILAKCSGLARRVVPVGHTVLTSFIDVGARNNIFWLTVAWGDGFTGAIIDAGNAAVKRSARGGLEAAVGEGLMFALDSVLGRSYPVEGGGERKPGIVLVDSGWAPRDVVYPVCRTRMREHVYPSKGQGDELELRPPKGVPQVDIGDHWYHHLTRERDAILLLYNTDHWKTFAAERLRTPFPGSGALTIWGKKEEHAALADHLSSEVAAVKEKRSGEVFMKWSLRPGRANHLWDCLVGCCVGAARMGVKLDKNLPKPAPPKAPPEGSRPEATRQRRAPVERTRRIRAHY